jgi:D-alanyl-D-alanine dipeptidase
MFQIINKFQNNLSEIPRYFDERVEKIEVIDEDEGFVNIFISEKEDDRIRMLPTPALPFINENYNAGFECSSLVRKSIYLRLKVMVNALDLITEKKQKISILVFEGLRDSETQKALFESCVNELKEKFQDLSIHEVRKLAENYVSPQSIHSTGACVDIRLFDEDKKEFLDMGKFGLIWGLNEQAHMFCAGLTEKQKENRHLLLTAASIAGLMNYPYEWWHFSYGDKYYAYCTEEEYAFFKSV